MLHPFEIPGVRNPTEDTPPTHRRLAENDTLVELIQTAEYLEDAPSWEQRRFYPPWYGDPYYRGHGRGCGRGRGRGRGWLYEHLDDRDTGRGRGRLPSRGNGRNDQDRNGFLPSVGRDIRLELPPEPARFTDWSSISSPLQHFLMEHLVYQQNLVGMYQMSSLSSECASYRNSQIRKDNYW